ncbi:hypothetical protein D3C74_441760 [compost metagenome]
MRETYAERFIFDLAGGLPGGAQCPHGVTVIGTVTGDEFVPSRLTILMVVLTGYFESHLIRI